MSLTKEECEKALDSLRVFSLQNLNANLKEVTKSNDVIEQLTKEHFELIENFKQLEKNYDALYDEVHNPKPLKFEELHEGMWVWDNVYEMYLKIEDIREDIIYPYEDYFCDPCDVSHNMWFYFEENRFYRKEVKQV